MRTILVQTWILFILMRIILAPILILLILLSIIAMVAGEILYIPFIPIVLYLYNHNAKFRHFWNVNMEDADHKVYTSDFILAGSIPGLCSAIKLLSLLFGI